MSPADQEESLAQILDEAERMSRLVQELLTLARADAGQHLSREPVELGPLVREVYRQATVMASGSEGRGRPARRGGRGDGPRRPRPPEAASPDPRRERAEVHAERRDHVSASRATVTRRGSASRTPGSASPPSDLPAHLRPVLPRRQGARVERHRPRPGHRQVDRRGAPGTGSRWRASPGAAAISRSHLAVAPIG